MQKFLALIIVIFLAGNLFFGFKYFTGLNELNKVKAELAQKKFNEKVLDFQKLFVEKVLSAEGEIDFETRLRLENDIRGFGDKDILAAWEAFTASKTQEEAQGSVKKLLLILVNKTSL